MKPALLALLLAGLPVLLFAQAPTGVPEPIPADPLQIVGPPAGSPVSGPELERCTNVTAGLLRCPVCQGLSVADSPASLAVKMKAQVRELHQKGYTEKQILAYFEKSYGQFVLLEPTFEGINWLVWLAPVGALALGGFVVVRMLRRAAPPAAASPEASASAAPADPELAAYLERARKLARGEKSD
jgi:cytochrome c-type biogenesis protein CcmH